MSDNKRKSRRHAILEKMENSSINTSVEVKIGKRQNSGKKKKRKHKSKSEATPKKNENQPGIQTFFKDGRLQDSAKKRTPPSAEKPESKRLNMYINQNSGSDESGSEYSTEDDYKTSASNEKEDITETPEIAGNTLDKDQTLVKMPQEIKLSPELELLKLQLKTEWDNSFTAKLEPIQNSIKELLQDKVDGKTIESEVTSLKKENEDLKIKWSRVERENKILKSKLKNIETTLRENNLVFSGIPEGPWEQPSTTIEKIYEELSILMTGENREKLKKARRIPIVNARRVGRYSQKRHRNISVTFSSQLDLEMVITNKKKLRKGVFADYEYDEETERHRRLLRPILKAARNMKEYEGKCMMDGGRLKLDGKRFSIHDIGDLPPKLSGFHVSSKSDPNTYGFFGELNPFSNFHPSPFVYQDQEYASAEHFIQAEKARYYGDKTSELEILGCDTALDAKKIGGKIKGNGNTENWNKVAKERCTGGIEAKFTQNKNLLLLLLSTNDQTLVECGFDDVWGTGTPLFDDNCLSTEHWTNGVGILGEILMEVRSKYAHITA